MKLFSHPHAGGRRGSGYTLLEMCFSMAVFTILLVGALWAIQIFALRIYTIAATKISATQGARKALNQLRDDIREGKWIQVGNSDNYGHFSPISNIVAGAVGNSLQIFQTTNESVPYSLYYLQSNSLTAGISSNSLIWISATASSTSSVNLVSFITNSDIFAAESWDNWPPVGTTNYATQAISNNLSNNQVYSVKLQFYQWEYPIGYVNVGGYTTNANAYDYYQVRTRVCRRALD
jgi:Tfp pilus assembly protein PilW